MKIWERYVVAHTILSRIHFFYFSEIKIGPLKRILGRGSKRPMRHHRPIDMRRTKKNRPHLYGTIQFSTASSIQNCIKTLKKI